MLLLLSRARDSNPRPLLLLLGRGLLRRPELRSHTEGRALDSPPSQTQTHYALALNACARQPDSALSLHRARELYTRMRSSGYRLDTRTLLTLDTMCRMHGVAGEAFASQMRRERSMATGARAVVRRPKRMPKR